MGCADHCAAAPKERHCWCISTAAVAAVLQMWQSCGNVAMTHGPPTA